MRKHSSPLTMEARPIRKRVRGKECSGRQFGKTTCITNQGLSQCGCCRSQQDDSCSGHNSYGICSRRERYPTNPYLTAVQNRIEVRRPRQHGKRPLRFSGPISVCPPWSPLIFHECRRLTSGSREMHDYAAVPLPRVLDGCFVAALRILTNWTGSTLSAAKRPVSAL